MFKTIRGWWEIQMDDHEHDWSKWEQYEQNMKRTVTKGWVQMEPVFYIEIRQRRHCRECGYTQNEKY